MKNQFRPSEYCDLSPRLRNLWPSGKPLIQEFAQAFIRELQNPCEHLLLRSCENEQTGTAGGRGQRDCCCACYDGSRYQERRAISLQPLLPLWYKDRNIFRFWLLLLAFSASSKCRVVEGELISARRIGHLG